MENYFQAEGFNLDKVLDEFEQNEDETDTPTLSDTKWTQILTPPAHLLSLNPALAHADLSPRESPLPFKTQLPDTTTTPIATTAPITTTTTTEPGVAMGAASWAVIMNFFVKMYIYFGLMFWMLNSKSNNGMSFFIY